MLDDLNVSTAKNGEDDEGSDEPLESYEDFEKRVNAFVAVNFAAASSTSRDNYKDGLVFQERKNLISQFIKLTHTKKCPNPSCGA